MTEIKGTNGMYLINEIGQVFSKKRNKFLTEFNYAYGYKCYCLYMNKKTWHICTHRLLAQAFIPNPENKPCVNHKNGVKTDNRLENLEWSTYSENNRHAYEKGFNKKIYGEDSPLSTITTDIALKILELYKTKRVSEISRELNLGYTLVRNICLRKSWKHL